MPCLPTITKQNGVFEFWIDDHPTLLLAGELHNSSSSDAHYMEGVWPKLKAMRLNTVIATVSWELIEPERGCFDFQSVDHLLWGARAAELRLILIWFGTWKNGQSSYVPGWVKTDPATYFRCRDRQHALTRTISPLCDACVEADAAAFSALMTHLQAVDGEQQTVLAVQVENEVGFYGCDLDCSSAAQAAFQATVPAALTSALDVQAGTWREVFGAQAADYFMSWHFASAVGRIAARGKQVYALPMFVNAWTVQYDDEHASFRPSGGPVAQMLPVWQTAAPMLDGFGADLYQQNLARELTRYEANGSNPLLLPELRPDRWAAAFILYALGRGALLASTFGIDGLDTRHASPSGAAIQGVFDTFSAHNPSDALSQLFSELSGMADVLLTARREGRVYCLMQDALVNDGLNIGAYHLRLTYPHALEDSQWPGVLLIVEEGDGRFLLMGSSVHVQLRALDGRFTDFLSIDEGSFAGGSWERKRRLNGDEQHLYFSDKLTLLRVAVYSIEP